MCVCVCVPPSCTASHLMHPIPYHRWILGAYKTEPSQYRSVVPTDLIWLTWSMVNKPQIKHHPTLAHSGHHILQVGKMSISSQHKAIRRKHTWGLSTRRLIETALEASALGSKGSTSTWEKFLIDLFLVRTKKSTPFEQQAQTCKDYISIKGTISFVSQVASAHVELGLQVYSLNLVIL